MPASVPQSEPTPVLVDMSSMSARERSDASAVDFTVKKNSKGEILNPGVLSKTVQSDADGCDLNKVLEIVDGKVRAKNGGVLINPVSGNPFANDFSDIGDYTSIKNNVARAESAFALLPVAIRNKFNNSVKDISDFLANPENNKEAVDLGLKPFKVLLTHQDDKGNPITKEAWDALQAKAAAAAGAGGGASGTGTP